MAAWWPYWISDTSDISSDSVPTDLLSFKSLAPMLLEIFGGNENPRWPPGSHIGFLIGSKIELELPLEGTNKPAKFQITCSNASRDNEQK